jgi:hypothetical protein
MTPRSSWVNEVLTARQHARTDRYRILYIPFALDPVRRAIYVLPNPFAERGRDLCHLEGSGLRYRFQLDDRSLEQVPDRAIER